MEQLSNAATERSGKLFSAVLVITRQVNNDIRLKLGNPLTKRAFLLFRDPINAKIRNPVPEFVPAVGFLQPAADARHFVSSFNCHRRKITADVPGPADNR
jgi:hypothetical protein